MVEEKARLELGMIKPDEIFVQLSHAAALNELLAGAPRRCSRAPSSSWGSAVTWLELVAFVLAIVMVVCNIRVDPLGWPLAIASSLLYFLLFWKSRLYGDAEPADLLRGRRRLGLVAMAARHRRHGPRLARARARPARPLDRARRARARLAGDRRSSCAASPTPTCPGGTRSRPRRASSASGCSAASTSRTGRPGSSSTSSASRSSPTRGSGSRSLLYAVFVGHVGRRLARLATAGRRAGCREARLRRRPARRRKHRQDDARRGDRCRAVGARRARRAGRRGAARVLRRARAHAAPATSRPASPPSRHAHRQPLRRDPASSSPTRPR